MRLIDTDVLVVAVNEGDERHEGAKTYLERVLNSGEGVLIAPASIVGFVRTITKRIAGLPGLSTGLAFELADEWLRRSTVQIPTPDARHFSRVRELLDAAGAGGRHVDDAHLAALALRYGATIVSFDRGFARFPGIKWEHPAA